MCHICAIVVPHVVFLWEELELLRGKQRQEAQELRSQQRSFFDEAHHNKIVERACYYCYYHLE